LALQLARKRRVRAASAVEALPQVVHERVHLLVDLKAKVVSEVVPFVALGQKLFDGGGVAQLAAFVDEKPDGTQRSGQRFQFAALDVA